MHAFPAKSVYGFVHSRQLLEVLANHATLRRLCGWNHASQIPHESTFSRAFAEFANSQLGTFALKALVRSALSTRLIGHIARDSSAIEARERFVAAPKLKAKVKTKKPKNGKKHPKKTVFGKETQAQRVSRETRIQKQLRAKTVEEMLRGIPTACDLGGKKGNNGQTKWWRAYKRHLDRADGQISITALLTAASVHDSQMAIPMIHMTTDRLSYLYDVMDSAYDAKAIRTASQRLNHKPIIQTQTQPKPKTQESSRVTLPPEWDPAEKHRYETRTMVERGFSRRKDQFLSSQIRVRGTKKEMAQIDVRGAGLDRGPTLAAASLAVSFSLKQTETEKTLDPYSINLCFMGKTA